MEDLPLEIQPLVMSLLSLKDAARTSLVARNWRKLWTCYPNLCFAGSNDWTTEEDIIKIRRAKFIKTVNSIIQQHNGIDLNKFSIRFGLKKNFVNHLDRWIHFATASKARIIEINLWPKMERREPGIKVYNFPLEALGAQGSPFIVSLFLKDVSIKPRSDIGGFTKLRRLLLHDVEISGDLPGSLKNCFSLEDLELIACTGVAELYVPHQLDKLQYLQISRMCVQKIDFHVTGLTHFEYKGSMTYIVLHGCSKLEKVVLSSKSCSFVKDNNALVHAFTAIPSISAVKVLHLYSDMKAHPPVWTSQMTGPMYAFMFLRHLTCEIRIFTEEPNHHDGILQFARYLGVAPRLEMLQLHLMYYTQISECWHGEATGEEVSSCMGGLQHLKMVYMSGFRCYRPQILLLCGILKKGTSVDS
ncbi:unnamed protein product [Urochloa decumbens]|uniref:F-box domain-containing protein n=1 Tax=Urochloa decumbens TaxID=240449 RepID=A0ABC8XZ05_9POAL